MSTELKKVFDKMSTEQLENLLLADKQSEAGLGGEAILSVLEVLRERKAIDENYSEYPTANAMWDSFRKNYLNSNNENIAGEDDAVPHMGNSDTPPLSVSSSRPKRKKFAFSQISRVACLFLVIGILLTGIFSVGTYAAGYDVWGTVVQWTKDTLSIRFTNGGTYIPTAPEFSGEYASLQEALDVLDISEPLAPTRLPKGYMLSDISVSEDSAHYTIVGMYTNSAEETILISIIQYKQTSGDLVHHEIDTQGAAAYVVNGIEHYLSTNMGRQKAVWANKNCEVWITGNITLQEMQDIICSIYER